MTTTAIPGEILTASLLNTMVNERAALTDLANSANGYGADFIANAAKKVASIAALRALRVPQGSDAQTVIVDGAQGGVFIWSAASTTADDGCFVLTPNSAPASGRWMRQYDGAANIKWFGVVGDGVTDDTAAIQSAINAAGSALTLLFPLGVYLISAPLTLANGARLVGVGDPTGTSASAIKVNAANYSSSTFTMFVKPSGLFQSCIFENLRFLGGGNQFYFDLSTGSAYKMVWKGCVFQDSVGYAVTGPNSTNGSGLLVCKWIGCAFINSGGIYSSGPMNASAVQRCSFENMRGRLVYVGATGNYPNLNLDIRDNRIEGLYSGVLASANACFQFDGQSYGVNLEQNYFENTFTSLLNVTSCRGIVFNRNTHTNSSNTLGTLDISDSQVSITNNYSLVGVTVNHTGTNNSVPEFYGNQAFSTPKLYGKTSAAEPEAIVGSGGLTLTGFPKLYLAGTNKLKIVPTPAGTGTFSDLLTVTSGSQAVLGSRACVAVRATVLIDVIDTTVGANLIAAQEFLITAWANAGGTMNSSIASIGATTSPNGTSFTLRQKAGATATSLTLECAVTNASLSYDGASKFVVLYEYVADENASSGLSIA